MHAPKTPIALTIAGSDSGGDAGIQADLKTFATLKVHGVTAITCLTAQNPAKVSRLAPTSPSMVAAQLAAITAQFTPAAAKTGMLYSAGIVREVARFFAVHTQIPLIVDPVIISTSGRRLLQIDGVRALKKHLLPLAALVTPNLAEAEILAGNKIRSLEDLRQAAAAIYRNFGCAALVKGGHFPAVKEAVDFYHGPEGEWMLSAPFLSRRGLHGTGCTYSGAITAWMARGKTRVKSAQLAKQYITHVIADMR